MINPDKKWLLSYGIHRGTLVSRDYDNPTPFESELAAREAFSQYRERHEAAGDFIWFATLIHPDGTQERLCYGVPYES